MTRYPHGVRRECPVMRAARRWVVSPLDFCVHMLPEGGHFPGGLTARFGLTIQNGGARCNTVMLGRSNEQLSPRLWARRA